MGLSNEGVFFSIFLSWFSRKEVGFSRINLSCGGPHFIFYINRILFGLTNLVVVVDQMTGVVPFM